MEEGQNLVSHLCATSVMVGPSADAIRGSALWRILRAGARPVTRVYFRLRVRGLQNVPKCGPALLLINHQSFLDPVIVGTPLDRPISFLARDSLFSTPILGWILRHTHVIPVNREAASASSLRLAMQRLDEGFLVGIFPEGTRSHDGHLGTLKPGFQLLLRRTQVPVLPVGIAGTNNAMGRRHLLPRPRTCRVVFGEPIRRESLDQGAHDKGLVLETVRSAMLKCQQEAGDWISSGNRPMH